MGTDQMGIVCGIREKPYRDAKDVENFVFGVLTSRKSGPSAGPFRPVADSGTGLGWCTTPACRGHCARHHHHPLTFGGRAESGSVRVASRAPIAGGPLGAGEGCHLGCWQTSADAHHLHQKKFLPKTMNFAKGAQNWRPVLVTQTFLEGHLQPPASPPPPPPGGRGFFTTKQWPVASTPPLAEVGADLEIECLHTSTGYTLFWDTHRIHTLEPWDTHVIHANHEKWGWGA